MAVSLVTEPTLNIYGITSIVNSLTQLRYVFAVDVLQGNDSVILEVLDASGTTNLLGENKTLSYVVPNGGNQQVVCDLDKVLLHIMKTDKTNFQRYLVRYAHLSSAGITAGQNSSQIIAIFSRLPLHLDNGSNMADFLFKDRGLPPYSIPGTLPLSYFGQSFQNPVWRSFLKSISFVADAEIVSRIGADDLESTVKLLDGAGNILLSVTPQPIPANDTVHEIFINSETGPLTFDSHPTAKFMTIEVTSASLPGQPLMIPYAFPIHCPQDPSIMIGWINSRGGIERWVFDRDFILNEKADKGVTFDVALIDDAATQQDLIGRASDELFKQNLLLTAENITQPQALALREIKKARLVWIALDRDDVNKIEVVVERDFTTSVNVRSARVNYSVQIRLPTNVAIEQILDYADVG
jgi:hypothetical protein